MDLTLSRPVKLLALVGVLVALAGGGGMMLLGRRAPTAGAPLPTAAQLRAQHLAAERAAAPRTTTPAKASAHAAAKPAAAKAPAPTVTKPAPTKPAPTRPAAHAAPPARPAAAKPVPKPAVQPHAETTPAVTSTGLPMVLAVLLRAHPVVVVSLFDPQSQTDAVSYAEARAGAADAGVGFLGVSVLDEPVAGPLTAILPGGGLLPDPGVLIYRAPGVLVERLDGFNDRDAVAQAAAAAFTDPPITAPAAPTVTAP